MLSTGIVRKVDELGRIVIPKEIRDTHGIAIKDSLAIYVDGDSIILKPYRANDECLFCGQIGTSTNPVHLFKGKNTCQSCIDEMKSLL